MIEKKHYRNIVVGSGPGGATVARELSRSGREVLIVEYGPRFKKTGFLKTTIMQNFSDKSESPSTGAAMSKPIATKEQLANPKVFASFR